MILNVAAFLLTIAALIYTLRANKYTILTKGQSKKLLELESEFLYQIHILESLKNLHKAERDICASLDFQLNVWKERNRLVEKAMNPPTHYRKNKKRKKRRKSGR